VKRPIIGMIVEGLDDAYEQTLYLHTRQAVLDQGAHFICFSGGDLRWKDADAGADARMRVLFAMASSRAIDGLIIPSMILNFVSDDQRREFLAQYRSMPSVSISHLDGSIPSVEIDNAAGIEAMVDHLVTVHRVQKFSFVKGMDGIGDEEGRKQGFFRALERHGLSTAVPVWNASPGPIWIVNEASAIEQAIRDGVQAIVCANENSAYEIISMLAPKGIQIPYNLTVTGFDHYLSELRIPRLTTVIQPFDEICRIAVELLLRKIKGEKIPARTIVPPRLLIQESCGCHFQDMQAPSRSASQDQPFDMDKAMHRAAASLPKEMPADTGTQLQTWVARLEAKLRESCESASPLIFLAALDIVLRDASKAGIPPLFWQTILAELHENTVFPPDAQSPFRLAHSILAHAQVFAGDFNNRFKTFIDTRQFADAWLHYLLAGELAGARSMQELARIIVAALPKFGLQEATIFVLETGSNTGDQGFFLVENSVPMATAPANTPTLSFSTFLKEAFTAREAPCAIVCEQLRNDKTPVGIALCQSAMDDLKKYTRMRILIGNAIFSTQLLATVQNQADELAEANSELVALRAKEQEYLTAIRRELDLARQIQSDFLPKKLPQTDGWDVAVWFEAAKEVSGDFYDVFVLPEDRIAIVIADVSGKSISAAIFMALIRGLVRALSQRSGGKDLLGVVPAVNDYIVKNHNQAGAMMFVTLFYGVLDTSSGWLEYINAGHLAPVILKGTRIREFLKLTGPAVGISESAKYHTGSSLLMPGDTLFAYTDGVTEARGSKGILMGKDKLYTVFEKEMMTPESLIAAVKDEILKHMHGEAIADDITMLALKRI
jgi:serine phosphatase RsbU (regulator of sigma subunit)/DNA-binding LacI/PurR family transcriptional regulator